MEDRYGHCISYLRVSITDRCNERCTYCMPRELQEWLAREDVLSYEETLRLIRIAAGLGVSKVRVTGGEPLTRRDVLGFMQQLQAIPGINDIGISTNGTLLARACSRRPVGDAGSASQDLSHASHPPSPGFGVASSEAATEDEASGKTMAQGLREAGVNSVNISLDTLDREAYAATTGRDFLPQVLDGIDAAIAAKFPLIKLNCVLMRGRNDDQLVPLAEFAAARNLILRFIELMPVSHSDVLDESNFLPIAEARRNLESHFGPLIPEPGFRTNGPSSYYKVAGRAQRLGFIGAMTNLHFCESCNKLRLTCDGKLRPCLGSYLEFDIMKVMRAGATDAELTRFFLDVVERKPEQHDFRTNYQPGRMMVAIGG
jgi:cyclic pyranopterin phosphate synthase